MLLKKQRGKQYFLDVRIIGVIQHLCWISLTELLKLTSICTSSKGLANAKTCPHEYLDSEMPTFIMMATLTIQRASPPRRPKRSIPVRYGLRGQPDQKNSLRGGHPSGPTHPSTKFRSGRTCPPPRAPPMPCRRVLAPCRSLVRYLRPTSRPSPRRARLPPPSARPPPPPARPHPTMPTSGEAALSWKCCCHGFIWICEPETTDFMAWKRLRWSRPEPALPRSSEAKELLPWQWRPRTEFRDPGWWSEVEDMMPKVSSGIPLKSHFYFI